MPEKELTVAQRATLLALMIKASALPRTFLADQIKISLDRTKRDDLVSRNMITVADKPIVLDLTEKGWARAIQELEAEAPPRGGALGGTLYLLLGFIREYLDRNEISAAEFFTAAAPSRAAVQDVETQIRKTYEGLADGPGAYVMLEDLRGALTGAVDADDVDAALRRLDKAPDVHLIPESNQKVLTPGQRAAAIRIGNQDMHLLAIRA